ncbi:short-chain dehydrogenase [Actinorhabdospora filicis]|uniref:Short-chain dehydrogenase n=1 Tax=Actinorhabdospora filicis TaxID=1785913 RepID=A0A9W6SJU1_9ACTN|nr:SDR family NAD(P)-dependent oxidoreductase [Actinorhabdospora filicis]GLZ77117.1 short-chain dehydrogenase [Actinorhabdospora filicis]
MSKAIAVFGAGPGLGQAVAHHYAKEGHDVALVARRREPLDALAAELAGYGTTIAVVTADLADTDGVPALAARVREAVGEPEVLYYAPSSADAGFVAAAELTAEKLRELAPLTLYTPVALVGEFLPGLRQILVAQGFSALNGLPGMSGPAVLLAGQRNWLQSLRAELAGRDVRVSALYVGAAIAGSAVHTAIEEARAAGAPVPDWPVATPAELLELLLGAHENGGEAIHAPGF